MHPFRPTKGFRQKKREIKNDLFIDIYIYINAYIQYNNAIEKRAKVTHFISSTERRRRRGRGEEERKPWNGKENET